MKVLSLFSGVGGFDLGLERAGMETVALCEWDKKAAHVLRRHWPDIPIYGDVSDLTGAQLIADGVHPDLVAFGSPCQDLSVAGKRAGLAGERSGLFHEAVRIIRELRELTDGTLPRWVIWENVVGALNSNGGADFGAVLDAMGDLGALFSEWAVLDAQNFGVAQRRRRVFLVSCLDPGAARGCSDPLLPVREGGPRDLVPLRAAWKESATRSRRGASERDYAARALGFGGYTIDDTRRIPRIRRRSGHPSGFHGDRRRQCPRRHATARGETRRRQGTSPFGGIPDPRDGERSDHLPASRFLSHSRIRRATLGGCFSDTPPRRFRPRRRATGRED